MQIIILNTYSYELALNDILEFKNTLNSYIEF